MLLTFPIKNGACMAVLPVSFVATKLQTRLAMHAQRIIQDLLEKKCSEIHAKRRACVAKLVEAARAGGIGLLKMSRGLPATTKLRHRIKCCDRLLSNPHLYNERTQIYGALCRSVLPDQCRIGIIIDWSDLLADGSAHLLRAAAVVKGRAFVLYEEVHQGKDYGSAAAHRQFLTTLRELLPAQCQPVLITDAGFRATWFEIANELQYEWIGRIRNRDMVRADGTSQWDGCKTWYSHATSRARSLGSFEYARSNPIPCRLVVYKKPAQGRHRRTAFGQSARSRSSLKNRAAQIEPWLLAVSPSLASFSAKRIVALYTGRMQIEQTFRDIKNPQWGLGLSDSQTRKRQRLAILLLLGALATYALWLIGLAAAQGGYRVQYGSKAKAATTLSIISLAQLWISEKNACPTPSKLASALQTLTEYVHKI